MLVDKSIWLFRRLPIRELTVQCNHRLYCTRCKASDCGKLTARGATTNDDAPSVAAVCRGPRHHLPDIVHLICNMHMWLKAVVRAYAESAMMCKIVQHWQSIVVFSS